MNPSRAYVSRITAAEASEETRGVKSLCEAESGPEVREGWREGDRLVAMLRCETIGRHSSSLDPSMRYIDLAIGACYQCLYSRTP